MDGTTLRRLESNWVLSPVIVSGVLSALESLALIAIGGFCLVALYPRNFEVYSLYILINYLLVLLLFRAYGLYEFSKLTSFWEQLFGALLAWSSVMALLVTIAFVAKETSDLSRAWLGLWYVSGLLYLALSRALFSRQVAKWVAAGRFSRRIAVLGSGELGRQVIQRLQIQPGVRLDGIYGDGDEAPGRGGERIDAEINRLIERTRLAPVDMIVVALPWTQTVEIKRALKALRSLPVDVCLAPDGPCLDLQRASVQYLGGLPLLNCVDRPLKDWKGVVKRCEDVVIAGTALLFFLPLLLSVAVLIKLDSPGPVLFRQKRFGFNNLPIDVFKFRTMYVDKGDATGGQRTTRNDPRITRIGRILRRTSIDELPQILNVLRGELSVVGPRAHPVAMRAGDKLYHEAVASYAERHRVRPGITGWAQINGSRGEIDTLEKATKRVEYDLFYIETWSLWLDMKILVGTIRVLFGKEVY